MLQILHLEDSKDDAFLIEQTIVRNGGIQARLTVVRDRQEFVSALEQKQFDLVLADNGLPGFDSLSALKMVRQKFPTMGFICVSGAATGKQLQATVAAGVNDFVLKDDLERLVKILRREEEKLQLTRMNRGMARLVKAVQEVSLARDLNAIMAVVRQAAREMTGADGATFVLRDGDQCYYADEYAIAPLWKGQRFPMKVCISGWAMLNRQPAVIEDIYVDPRIPVDAYRPTFVKSLAMVPIRTESPIGAIGNYWATRHQPTAQEIELLQALANTVSVAMENVQVYSELEQRVKDRTAQLEKANTKLEEANRELESFSHAVSHDLGAPLRSIRGFAQIALSENGAEAKGQNKECLTRIHQSAVQMRELMDDLLRLSKVSRVALKKERIDLAILARVVIKQLSLDAPDRKVEVNIAGGMEVEGDYGLLRIVLENLFSNAWKYTGNCPVAQIEFARVTQPDGSSTFCIRDNGAGFDMKWSNQLFQPFRRLHGQHEFPGTGIGLTTVHRIINRHGGRIWAEAEVGKGAKFYFTLGQ